MTQNGSITKGIMVLLIVSTTLASGEPPQMNNSFVVDLPYPSHFLYSLSLFNLSFPFFVNVSDPLPIKEGSFKNVLERPDRPVGSVAAGKFKREQSAQKIISSGRLPAPSTEDSNNNGKASWFGSRDPSWKSSRYDYFTRRTTTRPSEATLTPTRPALQTSPFRLRSSNRLAVKRGYRLQNETGTGVQVLHVIPRVNAAHLKQQQTETVGPTERAPYHSLLNPTTTTPQVATTTALLPVLPTSKAYIEGVVVRPEEVSFSTERVPRSQNVFYAANQLERATKDDRVTTYNPPFARFAFTQNYAAANSSEPSVASKDSSSFPEKVSSALAEVTKLLSISTQDKPAKFLDDYSAVTTTRSTLVEHQTFQDKTVTPTQLPKPDVSLESNEDPETERNTNPNFQSFLIPAAYYSTTEPSKEYNLDILPASDEVNATSAESRTESVEDLIRKYISSNPVTPAPQQATTSSTGTFSYAPFTVTTLETTATTTTTTSTTAAPTTTTTTTAAPAVSQVAVTMTEAPLLTSPAPPSQIIPSFAVDKSEPGTSTYTTIVSITTTPAVIPTNNTSLFPSFPNFPATQLATPASNNPTANPLLVQDTNSPNPLSGAQFNFPSFPAPQFNSAASSFGSANSPQGNFASTNIGATLGNITSLAGFNHQFPGISVFEALVSLQGGGSATGSPSNQGQQVNLQAGPNGIAFANSAQNPFLVSGFSSSGDGANTPNIGNAAFGQQAISPNFANQLSFQFPAVQQQNLGAASTSNLVDFSSLGQNIQQNTAALSQNFAFGSPGNFQQANINPVSGFPNQFGNFQQNLGIAFNPAQFGALPNGAAQSSATGALNAQFVNLPGQTFSLSNTNTATQVNGNAAGGTVQADAGSSLPSQ